MVIVLPTFDQKVSGSNPTGGKIYFMTVGLIICTGAFIIILPSSQYHLNNVEKDLNTKAQLFKASLA